MKHLVIRWNPATQEWFCIKCGRTSDHISEEDARVELDQHDCQVPSQGTSAPPGTKTRLFSLSFSPRLLNQRTVCSSSTAVGRSQPFPRSRRSLLKAIRPMLFSIYGKEK